MTVIQAFAAYLQSVDVATLGQNLFISRAPSSNKVADPIFWVHEAPAQLIGRTVQGRPINQYVIDLHMRSYDGQTVDETLSALRSVVTSPDLTLSGYTLSEHPETSGPWSDEDFDNEERTVGLLQVNLKVIEET